MADTDLNTHFKAIDEVSKTADALVAKLGRLEQAEASVNKATDKALQSTMRYADGIDRVQKSSTAFSQKLVLAGQSMALGFTVPIISSLAVLDQFDRSISQLKVGDSFDRTAERVGQDADEIIDALKKASHGTINETQLMISASRALTAGLGDSTQKLTALMDIARDRAQVFGLSTTEAFDRLIRGISKQEKEILDEVGILFRANDAFAAYGQSIGKSADQLTEAEKVQAFFTATIKAGEATINRQAISVDTATDSYERNRAEIDNTVKSVQRSLLPILATTLSGFNALPGPVKALSIGLFGLTLIGGPLLSAFGSVGKVLEFSYTQTVKRLALFPAENAAAAEQVILENLKSAAIGKTVVAQNAQLLTIARSVVAQAASTTGKAKDITLEAALSAAIARNTGLTGLNAAAVIARARALQAMAAAEGITLRQTQALSLAMSAQTAVAGGAGLAAFLGPAVAVVGALAAVAGAFYLLKRSSDETTPSLNATKSALDELDESAKGFGVTSEELSALKIQAAVPQIQALEKAFTDLAQAQKDYSAFSDRLRASGNQLPFAQAELSAVTKKLDDAFNAAESGSQSLTEAFKDQEITADHLQAVYDRLVASAGNNISILGPLASAIAAVRAEEEAAAYAASLLESSNQGLLVSFQQLNNTLRENFALQNAVAGALSTLTSVETQEELELQRLALQQSIIIDNRKLELNQFGKQQKAEEQHISALQAESDAIGKQISAIDIQIKEKELYIKTLVPPQLLQEIALLEKEVKVRQRTSFYMGLHINALQREANEIQRAINAIERQAKAVERANKPLQNQINLLDIQARKIELASRPARRRLEQLQKIPGVSQQVINAAQKEVDAYDDQLAAYQDSVDAIQIDIDIRQLQADAIRAQSETLNDQLDTINEEIEVLGDEQQAYDDLTSMIEDQIDIRNDYIETLVPPELQEEIDKLKSLRDELDLQKQKLDLLIPTRNEIKANTGDTFDPIINNAEAARAKLQVMQERLDHLKQMAAIDVKLKIGAEGLSKVLAIIEVLGAAGALNARGISLTDAIRRLTQFAAAIGGNWDLIFDRLAGDSEAGIAATIGSLPSAQHGGIYTNRRPTLAMLHGPEAIIPLDSPQSQRMLGAGGGGTTVVNNFAGAIIMADDPVFLDDLSRKIEERIVRRRR